MGIIFWIIVILLALGAFAGYSGRFSAPWYYPASFLLVVIALVLLGLRVFTGTLH